MGLIKGMIRSSFFALFLLTSVVSFGQLDDDFQYVSEFTWGVNKNTNSGLIGGAAFKLGRLIEDNAYHYFGLEILNVKHPKEEKYFSASGTSYIWGKQNSFYTIRTSYGREHLWFRKAPQQGVQISTVFGGGPSIGLIAPYYIQNNDGFVPFDPAIHSFDQVGGSGRFIRAIGESDIAFGVNAKVGLSFEFGPFKNNVAGIETGFATEIFTREIIIIPTASNTAWFNSIYVTLYWGTRR